MIHNSYIEISESAIENNLSFIRQLLGEDVVFSAVVKGNAYGHGIETYCPLAYKHGIRHFSVADFHEAREVYHSLEGSDATIMIMGMIDNEHLEWAIERGIEFYVFEKDRLHSAAQAAQKVGKAARIHIELETGMNRTGFEAIDLPPIINFIKSNESLLEVKGLCTHLAGAESIANYKRVSDQQKRFRRILKNLEKKYEWLPPNLHIASSAATIRYPKTRLNLVRVGILQYGFFPTQEILVHYLNKYKTIQSPLKRIVSWKTRVMDVKMVKSGQFVGYGTSYFTNQPTKIALLPIGYSSGYSRSLSNRGKVLIRGKRLDVIGTVNMNMMAVDISQVDDIKKGDEVVLIGKQGEQEITVASFSDSSEMVNYELLTRIPRNIPRRIIP